MKLKIGLLIVAIAGTLGVMLSKKEVVNTSALRQGPGPANGKVSLTPAAFIPRPDYEQVKAPTIGVEDQIANLESEISERQRRIDREDVVHRLNVGNISADQRQAYFDLLNAQGAARAREIQLRLQRLKSKLGG